MPEPQDLVKGTLDVLILKTLSWEPLHGYAVAGRIRERTGDALLVEEGALYPALHRLARRGWIAAEWGLSENNRRAKYYRLTPLGRAALREAVSDWERYVRAVGQVLHPSER